MSGRRKYETAAFILLVAVALVFLSNIPLLYGYLKQPSHLKFMGIIAGIRDVNFYFMMMMQVKGWSPVLHNYFASGGPDVIYHGIFWFLLGKISHILGVSELAVYHGVRIAAAVIFAPVAYWFVSRFLRSAAERAAALIMLAFGAGLGWVAMIWYYRTGAMPLAPVDVATPEASSFFTLMTFPHLSVALILIVVCFALAEASVSERKMWLAVAGGVCGLALGLIHAMNLVVIYVALGSFALISLIFFKESRPVRSAVVFGAISIWSIAYYMYVILRQPEVLPQVPVRSPTPLVYLVGFATFLLLSLLHIAHLIRTRTLPEKDLFLICWAGTNSLMLYSYPLLEQEARAVLGLQVPLVVLSSRAIFSTVLPSVGFDWQSPGRYSKRVLGMLVVTGMIVFTFPSTFCNIFERVSRLRDHPEAFSLTRDEYDALRFLRDAPGEEVVLSADWIGNYVPRLTHKHSWLGLLDVPSRDSRLSSAKRFFSEDTSPSARYDFLNQNDIGFIYYGQEERTLGGFDPKGALFLKSVFRNDSVEIYRVESQGATGEEMRSL